MSQREPEPPRADRATLDAEPRIAARLRRATGSGHRRRGRRRVAAPVGSGRRESRPRSSPLGAEDNSGCRPARGTPGRRSRRSRAPSDARSVDAHATHVEGDPSTPPTPTGPTDDDPEGRAIRPARSAPGRTDDARAVGQPPSGGAVGGHDQMSPGRDERRDRSRSAPPSAARLVSAKIVMKVEHGERQAERDDLRACASAGADRASRSCCGATFVVAMAASPAASTPPGGDQRPGHQERDAQRERHARRRELTARGRSRRRRSPARRGRRGGQDDDQDGAEKRGLVAGRREVARPSPRAAWHGVLAADREQRDDLPK